MRVIFYTGKLGRLRNIIVDREVTSLRLIANPDAFSIRNLRRTHRK